MNIKRVGAAGVNVFNCPICKDANMGGVLFAKLGMQDYARMRVYGAVTKKVECSNESHPHVVEVTLERPKGAGGILTNDD